MTPEERRVIEAAIAWGKNTQGVREIAQLTISVEALVVARKGDA